MDALLRQVTSYVVDCDKLWRFQRQSLYDAWEMENATNASLLTPLSRRCWFVLDRDYAAYNTLACVGNLQKSFKAAGYEFVKGKTGDLSLSLLDKNASP